MNTINRVFWFLSIAMLGLTACKTTKTANKETAETPSSENSLIWEISGKDLTEPSYLYGTIHIIGENDFFFPKGTEASFEKAKHLMLELDFSNPSLMMKIAMAAMMKDQTLADLLDEDQYEKFKSFLKDTLEVGAMEMMAVDRMKPILGMSMAYPKMIEGKAVSYEEKFTKMAQEQDMEVSGLETVDDQINALNGIPMDEQLNMLMELVDSFQVQKKMFGRMIDLYKSQNLAELVGMMSEYEELSNVQADLLDDRNMNWIPKIAAQAAKEPTFVAVGAAHLYGEKGVIELLRKEGYMVKALPQN